MILKSTLGADVNNPITTTSRLEAEDDEDDNVSKKVKIK